MDSDHQPIMVWVEGGGDKEVRTKKGEKRERRGVWTKEGERKFEEYFGEKGGRAKGWKRDGGN